MVQSGSDTYSYTLSDTFIITNIKETFRPLPNPCLYAIIKITFWLLSDIYTAAETWVTLEIKATLRPVTKKYGLKTSAYLTVVIKQDLILVVNTHARKHTQGQANCFPVLLLTHSSTHTHTHQHTNTRTFVAVSKKDSILAVCAFVKLKCCRF